MICRACQGEIDESAAFCPLCGADPLLGDPWLETIEAEGPQEPLSYAGQDAEGDSAEKLMLPVLRSAYAVYSAEAAGADILSGAMTSRPSGARVELARLQGFATERIRELQLACQLLANQAMNEMTADEFNARYPQLAWLWQGEYAAYLDVGSQSEAEETFFGRIRTRMGRLGTFVPASWVTESGASINYNGLLFSPFPGDAAVYQRGMEDMDLGPEHWPGRMEVTLAPAAWRHWADFQMAPNALVLVYENKSTLGNDLWGAEGPREALLGFARAEAQRLEKRHGVEVAWQTRLVANLPLVQVDFQSSWVDTSLVQRYVWVYVGDNVVLLRAVADSTGSEYREAVMDAVAGVRMLTVCAA